MMNRVGLGLAVGAGYVLGRTKKMKLAFAVGSLVAGKRLNLTPRGLADLVSQQLKDNPQFKEIGDQLRNDLRGVGKAASGAMVERQMSALADRLHNRTSQVRDQVEGIVPDAPGARSDDEEEPEDAYEEEPEEAEEDEGHEPEEARGEHEDDEGDEDGGDERDEDERPAKKAARKAPAKKAPAKKTAAAKRAPAKKTAAKKTASARKTATRTASRTRGPKGGGER